MSENMVINCQIKDRRLLEEILTDLGILHESGNSLLMYGYDDLDRSQTANVVIRRGTIRGRFRGAPNDLGFRFANNKAEIIISEYDHPAGRPGRKMVNVILQEYARRRVIAQARAKGYEVQSIETLADGSVKVKVAPLRRKPRARAHLRRRA